MMDSAAYINFLVVGRDHMMNQGNAGAHITVGQGSKAASKRAPVINLAWAPLRLCARAS